MMNPEEEFAEQVRAFLSNLYDHSYLVRSSLVRRLAPQDIPRGVQAMRHVRSLVLEALEEMNPGPRLPFRSPPAQAYNILKLRYVEGMTVQEVALEMATSERTLYRDLRKAEDDLAVLLSAHVQPEGNALTQASADLDTVQVLAELQWLEGRVTDVCLSTFLEKALSALVPLSLSRQVELRVDAPAKEIRACMDPVPARQVLIGAASQAIQQSPPGARVAVRAYSQEGRTGFEISCSEVPGISPQELLPSAAQQLIVRMNGRWSAERSRDGTLRLRIALGADTRCLVLVIDDNQSLFQLFQRYLADTAYRLIGAQYGMEGLRLAEEMVPDIVVLDIMMPQHDGWEVLQWFRTREATRDIPVLVCTVLDDPELALSLGAAGYLKKPVNRATLLQALSDCWPDTQSPSDPA